ncbi:unnamed protein product [Protopolystoma xenopodis]|uniref:Uncharacterized protein n=1 Tax=Protopolystoma xenopodis TaxID=117903 RepID=A0A448XAH9_9PLAT|nr:unnamed protein product [Protopolystoma xenopodis]
MLSTLSPLLKCCQSISSRATPAVHGSDEFHVPPREDSVAAALLLVNLVTSQLRPPSLALASPAPVTGATFLNHSATGLSDQMVSSN